MSSPGELRVAHYHPRALSGDGGPTVAVREWALGAVEAGARVVVGCEPNGHRFPEPIGVHHVAHSGSGVRMRPHRFSGLLDASDLLVLHSAWVTYNLIAARKARAAGVPYLLTPHGAYHPAVFRRHARRKRLWWATLERKLVAGARGVHVFFDEERRHLEAVGYRGPVVVAPNPVAVPQDRGWDGGSGGYLLWLGRFDWEQKGLDVLLHAMACLPPGDRPQLQLRGADWRDGRAYVEALSSRLGLGPWVTVGGPLYGDDKWELMERASGFVYPSRWEAFGIAPVEAAMLGVPLLATPYPVGQFLEARGGGIVAELEPEALGAGLVRLIAEGPAMSAQAAAATREAFSRETCARQWLEQVERLL